MFKVGSYVSYRSEGVCVISDIRDESFGMIGKQEQYYILTPVGDSKSTVFVPLANERLVSYMRPLMSAREISEMLAEVRDCRMEWLPDSRARNAVFREILSLGDRRELVILVNTVSEKIEAVIAAGRKPGTTDLGALRRAEKMLYDEFSATTDISSADKIVPLLRGEIVIGDKS
ncbi:MAG: CarD family transcriptional regulator [Clostridia bacterium]|nr:CarD family transcriptional regulator [Clostridia bacterium]